MFTPRRLLVVATAVAMLSGCASPNPYDGSSQGQASNESGGMSKTVKYGGLGALAGLTGSVATGTRGGWIAIGFAAVLFNFTIVNMFFKGLHAYSGLS